MDRSSAMEIVRETANNYGFEFLQTERAAFIRDGIDWSKSWVNFTIFEDPTWDLESGTITVAVRFAAATARMGGNQTVEDLLKAADTIRAAAKLIEKLNSMSLTYTVSTGKEA